MRYAVAVLLCDDLLEACVSGQGILKRKLRLALNERQNVVDELVLEAVLGLVYPLQRNLLLVICDLGEGDELALAAVLAVSAVGCGSSSDSSSSTADSANGMLIHRSQGLDFPHLELVFSTMIPMIISENPSKNLDNSMIRPTVAAATPT